AGLIYGLGHAIYTKSDPRARMLKQFVRELSAEKGRTDEFELYERIERIGPGLITAKRNTQKSVCANVDFYSGFAYSMLDLPLELYTPIFAIARIAGWSAHRMEEIINKGKIIRPAYMNICPARDYKPFEDR
ncbi:MAG: citrate synthase, partial [Clostridia bacterium]|nr:citrate synthase [Clostridia bacterium]